MGSFNFTCGFSNLPVTNLTPVVGMIVTQQASREEAIYPFDLYCPVLPLVRGTYNDYGDITLSEEEAARLLRYATEAEIDLDLEDRQFGIPEKHWLVMFRQDAFDLMGELKSPGGPKITDALQNIRSRIENDAVKFFVPEDEEGLDAMLATGSITQFISSLTWELGPGVRKLLAGPLERKLFELGFRSEAAAKRAGDPLTREGFDFLMEPIYDLLHVYMGMATGRRTLHPAGPVGAQEWEAEVQLQIGQFLVKTAQERLDKEREDDAFWGNDDDEEAEA